MKNNLRYGIRKHKLGAASVFLGTMIVVGMGQDKEAAASEQKTTTVEENGNSATDNKTSETQTTATNVNHIEETQSYNATVTEQPSNATQVTTEEAPKAVQAPQTAQPANVETVKEEEKPQVKETTQPQDNSGNQRQVDLTPKKVTQNQGTETQVEVAQPRTASESKPRVTRSADVAEAKEASDVSEVKGTDVTSKVTVESGSIEAPQGNKVEPHAGQRVVLKYKLKFADGLKRGDYFDFTLSNNVNTYGVSTARKVPEIKNGSVVMATGEILGNGNIRYTFTNEIEHKVEVTANLEINLFIDPKTVQSNGEQKITSKLNGEETEKTIPVVYNPGVSNSYTNVNGSIETFNKESNKFTHIAYIKPMNGNQSNTVSVTGTLTEGSNLAGGQPTVKVYEYLGKKDELPQSVYANTSDTNKFKDVTKEMNGKLSVQDNGSYSLNLDKLDKTYVIHYTGEYLQGSDQVNFRTELYGYPERAYKSYYVYGGYRLTWDNGLVLYSNKADGNGKNGQIIQDNDFEYKEDTAKGTMSGQYDAKQIIETEENQDNTPLDIDYHTAIDGEGGYVDGYIETIEETDSSAIDIDYHTAVDSEVGHVGGYTESSEESNPIDFEEDTLPKVSGQNEGQQTIEEDTTPPTPPTPEVPSEPETPMPPTPEVPSEPETPTPPTPEVPSEPETPTPPTPEVPSEPETPTPPTPEVPSEPETPTPPTPEVPAEPGKPVPPAKEEPKKPSKPVEQGKVVTPVIEINEKVKAVAPTKKAQSKKSELPETGGEESTNKGMLFGGLFSILGLALLRRNKKNNKA
ncbi:TPA: fibrinogen-binding adhesin SdrG C-terminal domain-containing protein [Staphylococcus aureus]